MELIRRAEDFLEIAKRMLDEGRYWAGCFSSHQAVELYIKGILYIRAGAYPFTHNLVTLIKSLGRDVPQNVLEACHFLNPHHTASRYGDVSMYDREVASLCLVKAEEVIRWLMTL